MGGVSLNNFPISIMFNDKICLQVSTKNWGLGAKKSEGRFIISYGKLRGTHYKKNLREYKIFKFDYFYKANY